MGQVNPELLLLIYERASPSLSARLLLASRQLQALVGRYARCCSVSLTLPEEFPAPPDEIRYPSITTVVVHCSVVMLQSLFDFRFPVVFGSERLSVDLVFHTRAAYQARQIGAVEGVRSATFLLHRPAEMQEAGCVIGLMTDMRSASMNAMSRSGLEGQEARVALPQVRELCLQDMCLPDASYMPCLKRLDLRCGGRSPNAVVRHAGLEHLRVWWTGAPGLVQLPLTLKSLDLSATFPARLTLHAMPRLTQLWITSLTVNCNLLLGMPALRHLFLNNAWLDHHGPDGLLQDLSAHGQLRTMQLILDHPTSLDRENWSRLIRLPTPGLEGFLEARRLSIVWARPSRP